MCPQALERNVVFPPLAPLGILVIHLNVKSSFPELGLVVVQGLTTPSLDRRLGQPEYMPLPLRLPCFLRLLSPVQTDVMNVKDRASTRVSGHRIQRHKKWREIQTPFMLTEPRPVDWIAILLRSVQPS